MAGLISFLVASISNVVPKTVVNSLLPKLVPLHQNNRWINLADDQLAKTRRIRFSFGMLILSVFSPIKLFITRQFTSAFLRCLPLFVPIAIGTT